MHTDTGAILQTLVITTVAPIVAAVTVVAIITIPACSSQKVR